MLGIIEAPSTSLSHLILICSAGLISTWLARTSVGTAAEIGFQLLFFVALGLVGLGTVFSFSAQTDGFFCVVAATFAMMVVSTVWDSGTTSGATA